ncbi:hypothetical protein M438DRAFT_53528 [Aureobasidium pullulans EXF-150]|uniref:Uncharacterized protein n=1 Tax=Aureobasidium pullulans EXF-150 TaxID=1043002 RepID=A0A074XB16_AURPU|nr:uncharacterized protein M438DRAFT_53528 [Aureobasidium pullulans EXF-150]KEQ82548.1 hypothetical protein M438DRAFT_53528 [Aureobasidium pullulans EXF-150]
MQHQLKEKTIRVSRNKGTSRKNIHHATHESGRRCCARNKTKVVLYVEKQNCRSSRPVTVQASLF